MRVIPLCPKVNVALPAFDADPALVVVPLPRAASFVVSPSVSTRLVVPPPTSVSEVGSLPPTPPMVANAATWSMKLRGVPLPLSMSNSVKLTFDTPPGCVKSMVRTICWVLAVKST